MLKCAAVCVVFSLQSKNFQNTYHDRKGPSLDLKTDITNKYLFNIKKCDCSLYNTLCPNNEWN